MRINIDRALSIEGWMDTEELTWLARQASLRNSIVELGSHHGRSTRAIADHACGLVTAIDSWQHEDSIERAWTSFNSNLCDHIQSGRLKVIRTSHSDYVPHADYVDMVFIDGSHDYQSVVRDVNQWLPRISRGGIICGHDFGMQCPGVIRAVFDTLPNPRQVPLTTIWMQEIQ